MSISKTFSFLEGGKEEKKFLSTFKISLVFFNLQTVAKMAEPVATYLIKNDFTGFSKKSFIEYNKDFVIAGLVLFSTNIYHYKSLI